MKVKVAGLRSARRHTLLLRDKRVCRKTRPATCPPLPTAIADTLHFTTVSRVGKNSADASDICHPDSAASRSIPAASHGEVGSNGLFQFLTFIPLVASAGAEQVWAGISEECPQPVRASFASAAQGCGVEGTCRRQAQALGRGLLGTFLT